MSTRCSSTRRARSPSATEWPRSSFPCPASRERQLAETTLLASLADETPEGRSIVGYARSKYSLTEDHLAEGMTFIPFTAYTRMSGVDFDGRTIRKGAVDAILRFANIAMNNAPAAFRQAADRISRTGGTPLAVAEDGKLLGLVHLKDTVKPDIRDRFSALRAMGIKTVMVTGDNPVTAAAIASEAGVDDFIAEATPEDKLAYIRKEQQGGRLIAMCGDGTNDAPALAQADVGVTMQTGTQAAREAGNMVDLDSNPTKLIEIVEIGKQLLMTRGSLTTFSIANDVAKYFAIIPALFIVTYPELGALNIMKLASPQSAILSAVIFNALIIIALIPLALKGVAYRPVGAAALLAPQPPDLRRRRHHRAIHRHQGPRHHRLGPSPRLKLGNIMVQHIRPAIVLIVVMTLLTGVIYPFAITGFATIVFPHRAGGSMITLDGTVIGSALIGQNFTSDKYFHGRPSATNTPDPKDPTKNIDAPYNAANSWSFELTVRRHRRSSIA